MPGNIQCETFVAKQRASAAAKFGTLTNQHATRFQDAIGLGEQGLRIRNVLEDVPTMVMTSK